MNSTALTCVQSQQASTRYGLCLMAQLRGTDSAPDCESDDAIVLDM